MIEPGNRTELRSGKMEMYSGTSTGPSGAVFFAAIAISVIRTVPRCDNKLCEGGAKSGVQGRKVLALAR
jgi:hypothetical protein